MAKNSQKKTSGANGGGEPKPKGKKTSEAAAKSSVDIAVVVDGYVGKFENQIAENTAKVVKEVLEKESDFCAGPVKFSFEHDDHEITVEGHVQLHVNQWILSVKSEQSEAIPYEG